MDCEAVLNLQYEAQHFGFHPRSFLDLVYNAFCDDLSSCLGQLKQFMINEYSSVLTPNVIQTQTDVLLQKLVKKLDKSIDKLEVYLNSNVFSIPSHVVLPEDQIHIKSPCTKEDELILDKEIEELKQKILEEKAKKFALKKKILEQKQIKEHLGILQNELLSLLQVASQEGVTKENIEHFFLDLTKLLDPSVFSFNSDI